MFKPLYQTSGRIDLFIPEDIFSEYKQTVMGILDSRPVNIHYIYENSHKFSIIRSMSDFQLIPLGSLSDGSVIRKLLYKLSIALYNAKIPHRLSVFVTSPFREEVKELLLQYFVWINKDIEFQSFYYERTVVPLYRSSDYGTKHHIDRFSNNLETLDEISKSFINACGLGIDSEFNQVKRLHIFNAQRLLNN